MYENQLTFD